MRDQQEGVRVNQAECESLVSLIAVEYHAGLWPGQGLRGGTGQTEEG